MGTDMDRNMAVHPSKIPTGTVLPVKHHVTNLRNRVKVGRVSVRKTASETIKQPVYLRQGYGVFLRKFSSPRREEYGPKPAARPNYWGSACDDYSGTLARALYMPNIIMTNRPITKDNLDPQLLKAQALMPPLRVSKQEKQKTRKALKMRPDLRRIVIPDPDGWRLPPYFVSSHENVITFVDHEERKPPPSFFMPQSALPKPVYGEQSSSGDSDTYYFTQHPLLRRPEVPVIHLDSFSSSSSSPSSSLEIMERASQHAAERRVRPMPSFVPHILPHLPTGRLELTSSRVQEGLVDLGDLFPYKADEGILAECAFYLQEKNFPLLLTRNPNVNLDRFIALNSVRMLPPERVLRVDALSKIVTRQRAQAKEVVDSDSDVEETCLKDNVFNPIRYPFNRKLYRKIHKLSRAKKL